MTTMRVTRPHYDGDSAPQDYLRFEIEGTERGKNPVHFADRPWQYLAILAELGGTDVNVQMTEDARQLLLSWLNHPERFPDASQPCLLRG